MLRFVRTSCLGWLAILIFGMVAIVSVLAVVFQQSQAVHANISATTQAQVTPTHHPTMLPTIVSIPPGDDVIIQIDTLTPLPSSIPTNALASTTTPQNTPLSTNTVPVPGAATDLPRYAGTSSYPLTVTAEVMLGLTHVAGYQARVSATRTAIAAESAGIYATLTAAAPIPTVSAP